MVAFEIFIQTKSTVQLGSIHSAERALDEFKNIIELILKNKQGK
jgi:hypothetical protein